MLTPEEEAHKARLLQEVKDLEERARARHIQQAQARTYSFARVKDAESLKRLMRFQSIFGRYIPELVEDEHATIHLHGRIRSSLFLNPAETYNKATFESDLKRFRKAIKVLAEFQIFGTPQCMGIVVNRESESKQYEELDEEIMHAASEIYDSVLIISDMEDSNKLTQVLDRLEGWAREATKYVPDRRNINWQAVHAVDSLRGFWESWTETPAPRRALNPASPFADYLRDAFDFFEVPGDPGAAFKRWVALEDAEPSKWK